MPSPDNFFDRIYDLSGFSVEHGKEEVKEHAFWIEGVRLQGDGIGIELFDICDELECEFFIGIKDLVDGFEDFITYSCKSDAERYKKETLDALRKAVKRIEKMKCQSQR